MSPVAVRLRLTHHARKRCAEMGVPTKEVKRAPDDPDATSYPSPAEGCRVLVSGRLAIPYDAATGEVITVLWRGEEERGTF